MVWTQLLVLFVWCVGKSDAAEVTITSVNSIDGQGSMECGQNVILMCKIQPYEGSMSWQIDNASVMSCTSGSCKTHPPYFPNYGYAFERQKGVFNITISNVTFEEQGKTFQCNAGPLSAQVTASVKVVPDNSTTSMKGLSTKKSTDLKVTTGCVYPTANIKLQWFIVKPGMPPVLYENAPQNVQMNASFAACTSGNCGGEGVARMSGTLALQEDKAGEEYFIQAVMSSSDFPKNVVVTSDVTYKLKFSEGDNSWLDNKLSPEVIVFLALACIALVTATVIIILVCQRRKKNPETDYIVKKFTK